MQAKQPTFPSEEKVRLLSLVDVFRPLSREQIEALSERLSDLRLAKGERFPWLEPMPLPKGSPFRLYRIG